MGKYKLHNFFFNYIFYVTCIYPLGYYIFFKILNKSGMGGEEGGGSIEPQFIILRSNLVSIRRLELSPPFQGRYSSSLKEK